MGSTNIDQSQAVLSTLIANVDWSMVDFDRARLQDSVVRDPKGAGERFTAFLNNGCRLIIGEPKTIRIDSTRQFNPTEFIGAGWTVWKGPANGNGLEGEKDTDKRSLVLTEVNLSQALFEHSLKKGESSIVGEEKLRRLQASGGIQFGANVFLALWLDYQQNKENSCLEWLWRNRKVSWMSFFGLVLRNPNGNRYVLYLYRNDDRWNWNYNWLDNDWNASNLSVGLATLLISPPT